MRHNFYELACELAVDASQNSIESRRGIWHLEREDLLCVYDNNPYDDDPDAHPGVFDTLGDNLDQNCDGVDGMDSDADGYLSVASGGDDCDDANGDLNPGADDTVGDEVDQNCDGADGIDADGDGVASISSGGGDCDDGAGAT